MRRMIWSFVSGWAAAQLFVCLLLVTDIGGVGTLIGASDSPYLPVTMLSLSLGALVGAASIGTASSLGNAARADRPLRAHAPVPVHVRRHR